MAKSSSLEREHIHPSSPPPAKNRHLNMVEGTTAPGRVSHGKLEGQGSDSQTLTDLQQLAWAPSWSQTGHQMLSSEGPGQDTELASRGPTPAGTGIGVRCFADKGGDPGAQENRVQYELWSYSGGLEKPGL